MLIKVFRVFAIFLCFPGLLATRICLGTPVHVSTALVKRELAAAAHSRSSPVNTAEGVFRLADDLRRERVSEGVDRIMASPVAVDRRSIRVITGWHLPGRDHNDNGRFAGKTSSYTLSARALAVLSCTISFGRINSTFPSSSPRFHAIPTEPSRYAALVIRYRQWPRRHFLPGARDTSRSIDRARVRWFQSIKKRLRFFVARNHAVLTE